MASGDTTGIRGAAEVSTYCAFLLDCVQSGEQLTMQQVAVIRGDLNEIRTAAKRDLGDDYDRIVAAAREKLRPKPAEAPRR